MIQSMANGTAAGFRAAVNDQISRFTTSRLFQRGAEGTVTLAHYHAVLTTLFHQTRAGPYTFARAAANCDWRHEGVKEYLLQHAEEERTHWRWVLDDLASTAYAGPDPRGCFPHPSCEAYISFLEKIAHAMPVARLASASVLEGIGSVHGTVYGGQLIRQLKLRPDQARFFLSHGQTDKTHAVEVEEVINGAGLGPEEWAWMTHAAIVSGQLYRAMYDHEAFA